jgi:archaellum component FlaC
MAEIDKIENQITKVDKLTASLGALTSKFTALIEEGKGFDQIQKAIGKRLEKARTDFTKLVNESDKFIEATRKNKDLTEEQANSLTDLEKKIKSLGSTYSTLANKNLQELKKAQSEYKKQLTELAEQAKTVAKEERDIIRKREADAKRALKSVQHRRQSTTKRLLRSKSYFVSKRIDSIKLMRRRKRKKLNEQQTASEGKNYCQTLLVKTQQ